MADRQTADTDTDRQAPVSVPSLTDCSLPTLFSGSLSSGSSSPSSPPLRQDAQPPSRRAFALLGLGRPEHTESDCGGAERTGSVDGSVVVKDRVSEVPPASLLSSPPPYQNEAEAGRSGSRSVTTIQGVYAWQLSAQAAKPPSRQDLRSLFASERKDDITLLFTLKDLRIMLNTARYTVTRATW